MWLALLVPLTWLPTAAVAAAPSSRVQKALRVQERLLRRDPGNAALHNDLGNLQLATGDFAAAEASYRSALELDPDLVSARFNLALLLQQQGHLVKARRAYSRVLEIDAAHAWAHYQLGILQARRGSRDKAIEHFAVALRRDRRLTDPAYNPHILDNPLAPSATLRAYADLTSVDLVPRTYASPRRILGVLVPELDEDGKPTPDKPLTKNNRADRKKKRRLQEEGAEVASEPPPDRD
jgi:tetratricopeptide (TPR) repeat protein